MNVRDESHRACTRARMTNLRERLSDTLEKLLRWSDKNGIDFNAELEFASRTIESETLRERQHG